MKYSLATLAFSAGASAASIQRSCTFTLTASGGQSGTIGQLSDGQNRVGGGLPQATYSINNGQITDSQGRGCILTPPTTQFQCDVGAAPTGGFSIGSNGAVSANGSTTFYACPASDDEYNIYTTSVNGQDKCVEVSLTASGCYTSASSSQVQKPSSAPAMSSPAESSPAQSTPAQTVTKTEQSSCPAPQTVTVTSLVSAPAQQSSQAPAPKPSTQAPASQPSSQAPAPKPSTQAPASQPSSQAPAPKSSAPSSATAASSTPSSKTCPTNLNGAYQSPHLIVPVSKGSPNKASGTSYNGTVTSDVSSIFNFDIPTSYTGGTCSLVFLFPEQSQLETSSYSFSGNGEIDFTQLSTVASQSTTYSSMGGVKTDFGVKTVTPGSSTVVSTFACPAGQTVSYELNAASGTSLNYFQDYNPSPIGLYITSC